MGSDKRYVIRFNGLFEHGYLKLSWWRKSQDSIPLERNKELEFATKFRFRWVANLYCRSAQNISEMKCDLRYWSVQEISNDQLKVDRFNNYDVWEK